MQLDELLKKLSSNELYSDNNEGVKKVVKKAKRETRQKRR